MLELRAHRDFVTENSLLRHIFENPKPSGEPGFVWTGHSETGSIRRSPSGCPFYCTESTLPPVLFRGCNSCRSVGFFCEIAWRFPPRNTVCIIHHFFRNYQSFLHGKNQNNQNSQSRQGIPKSCKYRCTGNLKRKKCLQHLSFPVILCGKTLQDRHGLHMDAKPSERKHPGAKDKAKGLIRDFLKGNASICQFQ